MSLEQLEREIAKQNTWSSAIQKSFIIECLRAQGNFKEIKTADIENIHQSFLVKILGDESIQYYTRVYLESVYEIY